MGNYFRGSHFGSIYGICYNRYDGNGYLTKQQTNTEAQDFERLSFCALNDIIDKI